MSERGANPSVYRVGIVRDGPHPDNLAAPVATILHVPQSQAARALWDARRSEAAGQDHHVIGGEADYTLVLHGNMGRDRVVLQTVARLGRPAISQLCRIHDRKIGSS